jgi:alpha-mannosidase
VEPEKGMFMKGVGVRGQGGKEIPVQVSRLERFDDGSVRSAEITFIAAGVPSIGYSTYRVVGGNAVAGSPANSPAPAILENTHYRIALAPGGVEQITDKKLGKNVLARSTFLGGELFTMQSIGEDAGEWADPQFPTMEGFDRMSNHPSLWYVVERGPVRDVIEFRQPIEHTTVVQRITLYHALRQIDFSTSLLGWDGTHYREFRLAFPVNVHRGTVAYEAPFETVEIGKDEMRGAPGERYTSPAPGIRPRTIQNWINASDSAIGITLSSSVAVWDYRNPTDSTDTATLLQPILMASRKSCNWEGNWYPQIGDHDFRFSITSHQPGWRNGRRFGVEANTPLTAVALDPGHAGGTLPGSKSFLSVEADNIVLSTMKKAEDNDDVILRLYEAERKSATARIELPFKAKASFSTNIIEETNGPMNQSGNRIAVPVGHQAIETYRFVVK